MTTQTLYKQELRGRILATAMREFTAKGIRKVKMDDIARMLVISKRTLYEIFEDKETILFEGIKLSEEMIDKRMREFAADEAHTSIDIIAEFYIIQMENFANVSYLFFEQLYKYPAIIDYINQRRKERDATSHLFFERGVREGYFREDVSYDIVAQIGHAAFTHILSGQLCKIYSMETLYRNIFFLLIRGVCTEKGVAELERAFQYRRQYIKK